MVKVLGAKRSSYYRRKQPRKHDRYSSIEQDMRAIQKEHRGKLGSPKMRIELMKRGYRISRQKVMELMKLYGIVLKRRKKHVITTDSRHREQWSPNLLNRDFRVAEANRVWVSDITYLKTGEGFRYLCVIIDLYSRKVVGWSLRDHMRDDLVIEALTEAYRKRKPDTGLIFHSDGGRQFVSHSFRSLLKRRSIDQSMSRRADPWDNAVAESFFAQLKKERIHGIYYKDEESLSCELFEYLEVYYNKKRSHSHCNGMSPYEYELRNSTPKVA